MSRGLCLMITCVVMLASTTPPVRADEDTVRFDGYSAVAELMVEKLLQSMRQVGSYSDEAIVELETGMPMGRGNQPASFVYVRPKRFGIKTDTHEIYGDGKQLTVYDKRMRRYTVAPLEKDIDAQIRKHLGEEGFGFRVQGLLLAANPRKYFGEQFKKLDLAGRDVVDQDRCYLLEGVSTISAMGFEEEEVGVTLWLREYDSFIRRVEFDLSDLMQRNLEESGAPFVPQGDFRIVYDVRDIRVNEPIPERLIAFKPPSGAKQVDRFYMALSGAEPSTVPFKLSGKRAPEFELESTEGRWIALDALHDSVVVLDFAARRRFGGGSSEVERARRLQELQEEFGADRVRFLLVCPDERADRLGDDLRVAGIGLTVLADPGGRAAQSYFEDDFASGIVLIGSDGIVRGAYRGALTDATTEALRVDIEKLRGGASLTGAKPISEEQITEAREQRSAQSFGGASAEPINEDDLVERWYLHARGSRSFALGGGSAVRAGTDLWIRDGSVVRRISPEGKVTAEVPIGETSGDRFGRDQFVAGKIGRRWGVVYMTPIAGEQEYMGWRPPKGATLTATDETGTQRWAIELEVENQQLPRQLTLADIDGQPGDELLFVHQSALWILDDRGEILVRKPITGFAQWLVVDNRDRDDRNEIYLRTQHKLQRFDYRPRR